MKMGMFRFLLGTIAIACTIFAAACSNGSSMGGVMPPDNGSMSQAGAPMPGDVSSAMPDEETPTAESPTGESPNGETTQPAPPARRATPSTHSFTAFPYRLEGRPAPLPRRANAARRLCSSTARAHQMRCFAWIRTDVAPATQAQLSREHLMPQGYGPADLQNAYRLPSATAGRGQTVAIVDAFYYPQAASDLAVYRATYRLSSCTTGNNCLRIVNQDGSPVTASHHPPLTVTGGWSGEQALDLDAVSAICPNCHILLVETLSDYVRSLEAGENTAARLRANEISNSWGGSEYEASSAAFTHPGIAITAAAGDSGAGAQQPCSFSTVVCVGGTKLVQSGTPRGWTESVWNSNGGATGSGCSKRVSKPSWQHDSGCRNRTGSDLAANADPLFSPMAVYVTAFGFQGWNLFGGTSESSPIVAAAFALAGNSGSINAPKRLWSKKGRGLFDVTSGNNEIYGAYKCSASMRYVCYAGPGYDGPTGWGTPNGVGAL
jgi:hypothetical protein